MEDFNEGVDGKLASRMRKVNPEQFLTLVKMHLSFELHITTEDNDHVAEKTKDRKWGLLSFAKKPKSQMNLQHKETALTSEGINQVKQIMEYLSKEQCIVQEGIFRRTGKLTRQQNLKNALYQGHSLHLEDGPYSVHDCASVLKSFLAELPEPLLTELHYPAHCQIAELCTSDSSPNDGRLLSSLQLLLLMLPSNNRILLKHLLILLHRTASFESSNKMNCDTLATLFTPHLMCPRKLSPEALHVNSQNLSGLVSFMIRMGKDLFDIPQKLATDIRAYWVDQERRLLSPTKKDLNESVSDATGTARTVYSFVDHKLTAEANSTDDTQAALAKLYAHIQAMPESAQKRRLVKQFNKENGQGTPRHVKQVRTKSLGDSIKKHIFQKKSLGNKKLVDINIGSNMSKSTSEENILTSPQKSAVPSKTLRSKSDDSLTSDSLALNKEKNTPSKPRSTSADSLQTSPIRAMLRTWKNKKKPDYSAYSPDIVPKESRSLPTMPYKPKPKANSKNSHDLEGRRAKSEPIVVLSPGDFEDNNELTPVNNSDPTERPRRPRIELVFTPKTPLPSPSAERGSPKPTTSPVVKYKLWNGYSAHTSTPADVLRRNVVNGGESCGLTPIRNSDKSMSPITKSTTKMPRCMQETMMTPRSRKPVMILSSSNLCGLTSLDNSQSMQIVDIDIDGDSYGSSGDKSRSSHRDSNENKENHRQRSQYRGKYYRRSFDDDPALKCTMSITNPFKEYLLSRSVLTASPVDLSFTSRTGDFEQSESDVNILDEDALSDSLFHCLDGNEPSSGTSGIASNSNSGNNSGEFDATAPRKRGTSLQRNDSKRSSRRGREARKQAMQKQKSESTIKSVKVKENIHETSF